MSRTHKLPRAVSLGLGLGGLFLAALSAVLRATNAPTPWVVLLGCLTLVFIVAYLYLHFSWEQRG